MTGDTWELAPMGGCNKGMTEGLARDSVSLGVGGEPVTGDPFKRGQT